MKILDDWKVYGGVSDLKQRTEGIPVSQVIINSNYSDDHDDYDIALMKLSKPLMLSGEASQLDMPQGWAWLGLVFGGTERAWGWAGARVSSRPLRAFPWAAQGCCQLQHPALLWPHCFPLPVPWLGTGPSAPGRARHTRSRGLGCAAGIVLLSVPTRAVRRGAGRDPAWVGAEGSASCAPRSSLAAGLVTTAAILLLGDSSLSPRLVFIVSPSSSGSPSLPPHVRPAIPDRQVLLHHRLWEDQGERR